jgi:hypothetical protein
MSEQYIKMVVSKVYKPDPEYYATMGLETVALPDMRTMAELDKSMVDNGDVDMMDLLDDWEDDKNITVEWFIVNKDGDILDEIKSE